MTARESILELQRLEQIATPAPWHDGGDGILFGHSADASGVWHEHDSELAVFLRNNTKLLLRGLQALCDQEG